MFELIQRLEARDTPSFTSPIFIEEGPDDLRPTFTILRTNGQNLRQRRYLIDALAREDGGDDGRAISGSSALPRLRSRKLGEDGAGIGRNLRAKAGAYSSILEIAPAAWCTGDCGFDRGW